MPKKVISGRNPWNAGRLGSGNGPQRLLFGQMYEDAAIEREAFAGKGRIFCIASAGNTAMRLAEEHEVIACDINPVQLAYAQSRANADVVRTGDAERAMQFGRLLAPLAGWRKKTVLTFLRLSDPAEQIAFWHAHLGTARFRAGLDVMLSSAVLRLLYAPEFLTILPPKFGAVMRQRWERCFVTHANATNPYVWSLLLDDSIPEQWRRTAEIDFVVGDAAAYLESCAEGSFDGFALSNILDGAGPCYAERLSQAVRRAGTDKAVVVRRSFAEPSSDLSANCAERDRSMLWGIVDVCSARML